MPAQSATCIGTVVRCPTGGAVSKIENGQARWYSNGAVYAANGSPAYKDVSCSANAAAPGGQSVNGCPRGPDMTMPVDYWPEWIANEPPYYKMPPGLATYGDGSVQSWIPADGCTSMRGAQYQPEVNP
eukprot:gene26588-17177_t